MKQCWRHGKTRKVNIFGGFEENKSKIMHLVN